MNTLICRHVSVLLTSIHNDLLQTFFKQYRPDAVGANFTAVEVNGGLQNQTKPMSGMQRASLTPRLTSTTGDGF